MCNCGASGTHRAQRLVRARLTLSEEEQLLYWALAARLHVGATPPDLVVLYLQASPEALFAHIPKRAVAAEQRISGTFLRALCEGNLHPKLLRMLGEQKVSLRRGSQ